MDERAKWKQQAYYFQHSTDWNVSGLKGSYRNFSVVQLLINDSGLSCRERFWNTTSVYVYVKNSDPSSPRNQWETPEHISKCNQLLRKCYNSNCLLVIPIKRNVCELNFSSLVVIGRLDSKQIQTVPCMHQMWRNWLKHYLKKDWESFHGGGWWI